ncbi:MAG: DUF21 domain-containing protein [Candidatus Oceanisphaera merdipullorum]|nr:DUF21 domain-containing protein [Candidatus Oceanisphaera merdipullorum]
MDAIPTGTLTGILIALLILSAFFSSSETGMMSINRYRLRHLAQNNHKSAIRVEKLLARPDRLIGLILIGNNLVNIMASAIATLLAIRLFGDVGVALSTVGLTVVVLIFSEVTPKTLAALYPERVAFPASLLLKPLMWLLYPAVWTINAISNGLLMLFRINPRGQEDNAISSEELRSIVNEAGALIPRRHQDMLLSILDLEKVTVDDIMVPRNEIYGIDVTQDWKTISRRLMQSPHTKVLLYRDNIDDALGFIHARDALRLLAKDEFSKSNLMRALRELYYIPEATPLNVQLVKFQRNKERIGLIVDEYGDIQGLVTLDDILEEIVGDFTTTITPSLSDEIKPLDDGSYLIEGSASIRDINKELGWQLTCDGPRSLNGLILEYLEEIPQANICVRLLGYPIEILEVENNMIKLVKVLPHYFK